VTAVKTIRFDFDSTAVRLHIKGHGGDLTRSCSDADLNACSDDDDEQVAARTEQPRQGSLQVQWLDGRLTFTQIAALATDPRAYHL